LGGGGGVGKVEKVRNTFKILVRRPQRKRPLGTLVINGRMILKWFLEKIMCECGLH
jgi:hypothetical protein